MMQEGHLLTWSEGLATGLADVDAQHQGLIAIINQLGRLRAQNMSLEELGKVFDKLTAYTHYHFQTEERLMQALPVSQTGIHIKAHQGFIALLDRAGKLISIHPEGVVDYLLAYLVKWLVHHITGVDACMAREIIAHRSGQDAVRQEENPLQDALLNTVSELYDSIGMRMLEILELNHRLEREIDRRRCAEEELRLASLVYHNSSEAMMVADADNRIIAVNPAFTQLTGYTAEEALGKDPGFLSSGRQDQAFYRDMWHSLKTTGHWQGEIWNRRKSGEVYFELLTINSIRGEDGAVRRFVALFFDITQKKISEELIWHQANFDSLTQLPNRSMFHDRLRQEIKKAKREGYSLAVLFIDLDHFKEVNDTLGHATGDRLLIDAAQRISACVRESDTVARLGGDEFTIILPDLGDPGRIEHIAQKILDTLLAPFQLGDEKAFISASIGITLYPSDATGVEDLLKHADQAMYVAKNAGRNRYSYFTPALQEAAQARLHLTNDLRAALQNREFRVYFQPIVHLPSGRIHKAEALIRWLHPERGMVGPADFIPLAEETGLIHEIGAWVFQESANWVKRWKEIHCSDFKVSVNKSPLQFYREADNHVAWLEQLHGLEVQGQSIVIEITEGLLLNADPAIAESLHGCRIAGIQISIDDFGTGYSSLAYLKKFDVDYLKIDQSFVRDMGADPCDLAIIEAIIVMAHKLGLMVIAEGVETEAQRDLLVAAGCDYAQGYWFSRPVPPEQFEAILTASRASCHCNHAAKEIG